MNHATFLAVLALMSFTLPLFMRLLPMLNPNLLMLLSIAFVIAIFWQLWQKRNLKQTLNQEESDFSSPLLNALSTEEDYHASL